MTNEVGVKKELIERENHRSFKAEHQPAVVNHGMIMIDLTGDTDSSDDDDIELVSMELAQPGRRQCEVKDVKVEQKPSINAVQMSPRKFRSTPNAPPMETSAIINALQGTMQGATQPMWETVQQKSVSTHDRGVNVQATFHFTQLVQPAQQQRKRRRNQKKKPKKKRGGPRAIEYSPMHNAQGFQGNVHRQYHGFRRTQTPIINQAVFGIKIEASPAIKREFPVPTPQKVSAVNQIGVVKRKPRS